VAIEREREHWYLRIDHFQGDHWHDDEARAIWLAIAPHMADDASIEFQGEDLQRWRIRWLGGRCFEDRVEEVVWIQDNEIGAPNREESRT